MQVKEGEWLGIEDALPSAIGTSLRITDLRAVAGDSECDLAMTELFGGFSPRF